MIRMNEWALTRERKAELAYRRCLIERERSQLERVLDDQGIVVHVYSSTDKSLAKAGKPEKKVEYSRLKEENALDSTKQRTAVRTCKEKTK